MDHWFSGQLKEEGCTHTLDPGLVLRGQDRKDLLQLERSIHLLGSDDETLMC